MQVKMRIQQSQQKFLFSEIMRQSLAIQVTVYGKPVQSMVVGYERWMFGTDHYKTDTSQLTSQEVWQGKKTN